MRYRDEEIGTLIIPPGPGADDPPAILGIKYASFAWTHTDAKPEALKGFRLVVFTGTDPNATDAYLTAPRELGPAERSTVVSLGIDSSVSVNAAIQALYHNGNESSWRLISGAVATDPDTLPIATRVLVDRIRLDTDAAAAAAAAAQTAANTANAALADIAADGKLTPIEKHQARQEWDVIAAEKAGIDSQADTFAQSRTTYDAAFQALATYLNAGTAWASGVPSWLADANLSATTVIVGSTFRSTWKAYYDARTALLNAIAAKSKALADAAQGSANNAATAASAAHQRAVDAESNAISAAATDASNKMNSAINAAATDATTKANAARTNAVSDINAAVGGVVTGATSAADAVSKLMGLASAAQAAADGIRVGGRNLALDSAGMITTGEKNLLYSFESDINQLRGKDVTLSLDVELADATGSRVGFEPELVFSDGSKQYLGLWITASDFKGRIQQTYHIADKPVTGLGQRGIYIQMTGTITKIGNPKFELGNRATDWTPAPEDVDASIQAAASAAQTLPTYASPSALPAASGFAPGYGPVLTISDYSLWKVNSGATAWDRILFGAEGIFGKVTVDHLDVTDALRAAVVDAPHVKTQLLTVMSDATASGPGGAVQIGGGAIKAEAISVKHLVVGDFTNLCTNPSGERGLEGWTSNVTEAFDMGGWWGAAGLKCLMTTDRDSFFGQYINVTPGEVFAFSVEARPCSEGSWPGQAPTAPFAVGLQLFSNPGACADFLHAASASYTNPDWQTAKGQVTVPAGAKLARIWVQIEKGWGSPGYWTFRNLIVRRAASADMIVDGAIVTQKLSATCASTANFTQGYDDVNGGIYAAAGAAMVVNTPSTPALITDAAGLKIGKRVFTDYWFRLMNAIDGSYSGGILVWRGNNDTTVRNGASNIDCLDLVISNVEDNALLRWRLKPTSLTDNLDGMHQLRAQVFKGVGGATPGLTIYPELRDRYYVTANHGDAANEVIGDAFYGQLFKVLGTSYWYNGFVGHLLVDMSNSYGWSAQRWFHPTASGWYTRDSTAPAGAPAAGDSSAGGSLGGGCPAPWVPVLLASGLEVQAGSLRDGMTVVGVDDCTGAPSVGTLRGVERRWVRRVRVVLEDGRAPEFTATHRLGTVEGGWCEAQHLKPGQLLAAQRESRVRAVEAAGHGQVVSFEVEGCHTYFAGGLLSHNYKAGTL